MKRAFVLLAGISLAASGCSGTQADDAPTPQLLSFSEEIVMGDGQLETASPFFKVAPDGEVWLSWVEKDTDTEGFNVFVAPWDQDREQFGERRRMNDQAGEVHWYGGDNRPKLTVTPDGNIAAIWPIPSVVSKTGNIRVARGGSDGPFSPALTLNDDENPLGHSHAFPTISSSPDGKIYATWIDGRNRPGKDLATGEKPVVSDMNLASELFMAVSEDGGATYSKNYSVANDVCACCVPNIVFLDEGQTLVVSHRLIMEGGVRDHVLIRSTDSGQTFGDPVLISDDGWVTGCPHAGISLASDSEDRIHGLWFTVGRSEEEAGIYYTFSEDGGLSFSPRQLVAKTPASAVLHTQVTVDANDAIWATWVNLQDEKPQIFLAHREPGQSEWSPSYQLSDSTRNAVKPSMAIDSKNVYVAWTELEGENRQMKLRWAPLGN